jgi:hypothetical protein
MLHPIIKWREAPRSAARSPLDEGLGVAIRFAYPDDAAALRCLAILDSRPLPPGPLLVAEVAGELWAALSATGAPQAIADPFRHAAELVALVHERANRFTRRPQPLRAPQPLQSRRSMTERSLTPQTSRGKRQVSTTWRRIASRTGRSGTP